MTTMTAHREWVWRWLGGGRGELLHLFINQKSVCLSEEQASEWGIESSLFFPAFTTPLHRTIPLFSSPSQDSIHP